MTRAKDLFEKIRIKKNQAIDELIADKQFENLFLDFKRISTKEDDKKLNDDDRKNYAKAISGFGNSEGGIIIWGVDCSTKNGDIPKNKYPIKNPEKFASLLESCTSGCTLPPHNNVCNEVIYLDGSDQGFVVSYIPRSSAAPHQVNVSNKKNYYIRAGSSFEPAPHGVLAWMFGNKIQPELSFHFTIIEAEKTEDNTIKITFKVNIENNGPTIAHKPYFTFRVDVKSENTTLEYLCTKDFKLMKFYEDSGACAMLSQELYCPPGSVIETIKFSAELQGPKCELALDCLIGSENTAVIPFQIKTNEKIINNIITQESLIIPRDLAEKIFTSTYD